MSNRTQFELNYLRDSALIIYVNLQLLFLTVYLNHFELENGVMTTPKRRSILPALIFTCFCITKSLLIKVKVGIKLSAW